MNQHYPSKNLKHENQEPEIRKCGLHQRKRYYHHTNQLANTIIHYRRLQKNTQPFAMDIGKITQVITNLQQKISISI